MSICSTACMYVQSIVLCQAPLCFNKALSAVFFCLTNGPYSIHPCNHAFCSPCTDDRGSKFCPQCRTKVDRIVSVAAPMTVPGAAEPVPQPSVALDHGSLSGVERVGKEPRSRSIGVRKVLLICLPRRRDPRVSLP